MPATKLLYLSDSHLKETTAKVIKVEKSGGVTSVFLNQTIFYPTGGGQLFDTGLIKSDTGTLKVTEVLLSKTTVVHHGQLSGSLTKGQTVHLTLDWDRRYQHMQQHTAGHLLDEAVKDLLPEHHGITARHGVGHQWFVKFTGFIDTTFKDQLQTKINDYINLNESIISRFVTLDIIESEHIFIPFKLPENKPLRLIRIGERDWVPDGGTQLLNTSECWPINLTEFTYEDGLTTIHYQVSALQKPRPIKPIVGLTLDQFRERLNKIPASPSRSDFKALSQEIPKLPEPDRAAAGQLLNQLKKRLEPKTVRSSVISDPSSAWTDVTAPGISPPTGHLHLISQTIDEIETIFSRLGFIRRRYPEIETDWYYAEGLNIPKDHPARDDQETFYFSDNVVLTAHTSSGQLREMELVKTPPIKMINIGKTYRRQASATHSPMFHQFEGLLIDTGINMSHLVGVSNYFAKAYFGPDRQIRLRPHHFQFTEPSFEVDINCHLCQGRGVIDQKPCRVCKSGWLELGGAGMVHPVVLKNGGLDASKYTGFAFGWGVERIIMMKHQVTSNLRELYTDDLRFLEQS